MDILLVHCQREWTENFKSVYVIRGQKWLTTNMYQSTVNDAKRVENTFTGCTYSRPDLGNLDMTC